MELRPLIGDYMLYVLLPLWFVAGVADYWCHRRTCIETTSGLRESVLHVLQAAQIGIALLAGLLLEINATVLLVMLLCVIAHSLTAVWDAQYTTPRRYISPFEQHVHSHLEYIPLVALSLVALLYWNRFTALWHAGSESASFSLRAKSEPLETRYLVIVLVPVLLVQGALLAEEAFRCQRARARAGLTIAR
jgi:hypothetical protein